MAEDSWVDGWVLDDGLGLEDRLPGSRWVAVEGSVGVMSDQRAARCPNG